MKKVAIIGGGISGLYIASLLRLNSNYEIIVYEKNNSVNLEKGYGIQLSVNSIKLLNKIGFQNINFKEKFFPNKVNFYSLKDKNKICDLDISAFNESEVKYTTLQRFILIDFLTNKLPSNLINFNKKVIDIQSVSKTTKVIFEDKSSIECDYLIISDGAFSKTRSLITDKEIKPKYFNSIAVRGNIDRKYLQNIDHNNISLFLGSNLHSVVYPVNHNGYFNFVTILRKDLNNEELADYSLFDSKEFISSALLEISKQVDNNIIENLIDIKCFPIFTSTEIFQPKNKNIYIIGDAFFSFPPTFAQGASQSIEVAHELYQNFENIDDQFNKERIKRTKMIDRKSRLNYFAFHLSNPLIIFVRNLLLRYLVKNNRFINSYLGKIYKN
ncbi:FAD-dependent monooxygenase [Candidatus Pelagibacter sp. Uisw_099_02]|uniref:FAD-dependent monooxygenase n=1 Tax=Candidatus Pelagibacter sp. Uisw_099_02 TaxID=3230981 RepID=UPI0039EAE7E7